MTAAQPWIVLTADAATAAGQDKRTWVEIDWAQAPAGTTQGTITFSDGVGSGAVNATAIQASAEQKQEAQSCFGGLSGPIAFLAADATQVVPVDGVGWERIRDYGRRPSAMEVFPVTAASIQSGAEAPRLKYSVFFAKSGTHTVDLITGPTLNIMPPRGLPLAPSPRTRARARRLAHELQPSPAEGLRERARASPPRHAPHTLARARWRTNGRSWGSGLCRTKLQHTPDPQHERKQGVVGSAAMRQSNSPIPLGVGVLVLAVCGACVSQSQEGPSAPLPAETGAPKYTAEPVAPPQTEEQSPTPTVNEQTYSVFVIHTVTDFDSFKRYLDKNDEFRRKLGAIAHVLSRVEGQEHQVIVHYIVRDLERVETFLYSDEVAELARQPGSPEDSKIIFADDVEYQVVNPWPPGTFTAFYKFEVRDFDAWKQRFDGNANARQKMGIIGYGVHKARGEDKTVMVHFIATSLDTIRKFTTMPEVLQTFKDAGIQGTPTPLLAMDVEIKRYGGPAASGSSQQ